MKVMRSPLACLAGALAICCLWAGAARADVNVSVGFLNTGDPNYGAPPPAYAPPGGSQVPFPFDNSPTNTLLSIWNSTQPHATGVLLFQNTGPAAVTIDSGLHVQIGNTTYQVWDSPLPSYITNFNPSIPSLPFTLAAGHSLVVAETWNFNFDTGETHPNTNPIIAGSINGVPFSFEDSNRVLYGHEGAETDYTQAWKATTPYSFLGTAAVPEPGTLALVSVVALAGLGGGFVRRRISRRPLAA
jgi:hypothetical protein